MGERLRLNGAQRTDLAVALINLRSRAGTSITQAPLPKWVAVWVSKSTENYDFQPPAPRVVYLTFA